MGSKRNKIFESLFYLILISLVIILFYRFTMQNSNRIQEQNRVYAEDSARQIAKRIADHFASAQQLIKTYTYFLEHTLDKPEVTNLMLAQLEKTSSFDGIRFTDLNGQNYSSEGSIVKTTDREFYIKGIAGKSGITTIMKSRRLNKPILGIYGPVHYEGKIFGVLHGAYISDSFLRSMLEASYFGVPSNVFLCQPDGQIIATSMPGSALGNVLETLKKSDFVDERVLKGASEVFKNGGSGVFTCSEKSKIDNLCVMYLPGYDYVLVQAFPQKVTAAMLDRADLAGIELEIGLLAIFAVYAVWLVMRGHRQKKRLENENRELSTLYSGLNILFSSRYCVVNLETMHYRFIASGDLGDSAPAREGTYEQFLEAQASLSIDPETRENFLNFFQPDNLRKLFEKENVITYECHVIRDGKPEWENIIATCLEKKDGRPVKILFLRQNVSDMKQRELQTKRKISDMDRKERQYRLAITSNAICDFEFNVTRDAIEKDVRQKVGTGEVSRLEMVGLSAPCKASELFKAWSEKVLPEARDEYLRTMNPKNLVEKFENGILEIDLDYWRNDPSGGEICVRQSIYLSRDEFSGDIMAMTVARNITEQLARQRAQTKALQDALMLARHANEAKTSFLSNMSHDIRTPMNAIIGFTTIAANHVDNREQVRDCLQKVLSSSNHLLSLINDILDMSRIESGKMQVKEQDCNISELMHNLVTIIQPQAKAKQMQLFIDTFEVTNEDIITDPLKLNQVFINLLSNAVKYTPAGGKITFRLTQKPAFKHGYADYIFEIEDNGMGMDEEFVTHIFEPFTRASTTTRNGIQGTGLGMAITKNIVDILNGEISVKSAPGVGSTFTVTFTLKLQEKKHETGKISELEGMRALVVDDDFHVCQSVCKMLEKVGFRTDWTMFGNEASCRAQLAYDQHDPFDTYIIDWHMPDLNGVETTRQIRRIVGAEASIIILTAYEWSDIEDEAKDAGVTAFCAKPLFMSDLKNALLSSHNLQGKKTDEEWSAPQFARNARILLVEDLDLNREIAEYILTEGGFEVDSAPDGSDAVEMVRNSPENYYSAILMDVQMPTMNGYEATQAIRNLDREDIKTIPIIAMTANALEEDKAEALKCGMNDHIAKPIDIKNFLEVMRKFFK